MYIRKSVSMLAMTALAFFVVDFLGFCWKLKLAGMYLSLKILFSHANQPYGQFRC